MLKLMLIILLWSHTAFIQD